MNQSNQHIKTTLIILLLVTVPMVHATLLTNITHYYAFTAGAQNLTDSLQKRNLTNYNAQHVTTGIQGGAYNYTQIGDYQVMGLFNHTGSFTITMWLRTTPGATIPSFTGLVYDNGLGMGKWSTYLRCYHTALSGCGVDDSSAFTTASWIFMACTFDAATKNMSIYHNASLKDTDTCNATATYTSDMEFGRDEGSSTRQYNGTLDEIGFWSRALTPTEITTLYNNGLGTTYPFTDVEPPATTTYNHTYFRGIINMQFLGTTKITWRNT